MNRVYGGVLSGGAVKERIIRAFLVEEQNDCEEGLEDSKGEGKTSLKELKERLVK